MGLSICRPDLLGGGWKPSELTNIWAWYDVDQDPNFVADNPCSELTCLVSGRVVEQASSLAKPTYRLVNGNKAIEPLAGDFLRTETGHTFNETIFSTGQDWTVGFVAEVSNVLITSSGFGLSGEPLAERNWYAASQYYFTDGGFRTQAYAPLDSTAVIWYPTPSHPLGSVQLFMTELSNDSDQQHRFWNTRETSPNQTLTNSPITTSRLTLGAAYTNNNDNIAQQLNNPLYEVILVKGLLTAEEKAELQNYITAKYGLV
jgi:hypothetical protein